MCKIIIKIIILQSILINYLKTYPLWTSKHLDFIDWENFLKNDKGEQNITPLEKTQQILIIKNSMNNSRTNFNWVHLKSFYTFN